MNFACELATNDLSALFADGTVVQQLAELGASVTLGLLDLSPERAAVVRSLNTAGLPVYAWLLLPLDQGYWCNVNNAPQAARRYADFRVWTAEQELQWDGVGIDVEPDTREIQRLLANRWTVVPAILRRLVDDRSRSQAAAIYAQLVAQVRADGYPIHSYELPFLEDERRVGASLLQRVLGVVPVGADREVPMLYSSFLGARGPGLLWSYGQGKDAVIVGSTGGGVSLGGADQVPALTWEEFSRDLRLAARLTTDIGVFSLEGCVRQGFLPRLRTFDWNAPVEIPTAEAVVVDRWRMIARAILWVTAHPYVLALGLGSVLAIRRVLVRGRAR
jgi:hypothetical protein